MRKMRRAVLWIFVFWMMNILQTFAAQNQLPDELQNIYARSAVIIDGSSGRVLFGKNTKEIMPMASTTKIMTCIFALENCSEKAVVTVSKRAASQPEVHLGADIGETFYMEDLLYALMLESYNDAAVMIAEQVSGSVEAFVSGMNQKAKELGCENTHFVTPNGLDEKDENGDHGTTAEDLAEIMKYCAWDSPKSETFLKITQTRNYSFSNLEGSRNYSCNNHNMFLDMYEGTISGKTGFTSAAGYCYVTAVESGERKFVGVVLACGWPYNRNYKWKDMTRLMDYAKTHYHEQKLEYPEKTYLTEIKDGWVEGKNPWETIHIPLHLEGSTEEKVLIGEQEKVIRYIVYRKIAQAPIEKGEVLGKIQFLLNDEVIKEGKIMTQSAVESRKIRNWFVWILQKISL